MEKLTFGDWGKFDNAGGSLLKEFFQKGAKQIIG